jgi:hypothetical protein
MGASLGLLLACRYYTGVFHSNVGVGPYIQNLYVNITADTIGYIKKGGIPLVIGEWSLAGAQPMRAVRLLASAEMWHPLLRRSVARSCGMQQARMLMLPWAGSRFG